MKIERAENKHAKQIMIGCFFEDRMICTYIQTPTHLSKTTSNINLVLETYGKWYG